MCIKYPKTLHLCPLKGIKYVNQVTLNVFLLEKLKFKLSIIIIGVWPAKNRSLAPELAPQQSLLGAAACALGLVLVFSLIASAMYVRARKQIRQDSLQ
jgi:hypothetical protein